MFKEWHVLGEAEKQKGLMTHGSEQKESHQVHSQNGSCNQWMSRRILEVKGQHDILILLFIFWGMCLFHKFISTLYVRFRACGNKPILVIST